MKNELKFPKVKEKVRKEVVNNVLMNIENSKKHKELVDELKELNNVLKKLYTFIKVGAVVLGTVILVAII